VRWQPVVRRGSTAKLPLTVDGAIASSTDPATWSTYTAARRSRVGAGAGFVLNGDGISCYDFDHVLDADGTLLPAAVPVVLTFAADAFWVERSPSGDGLHAWVHASSQPGWRRTFDGVRVEFYSRARFMTITGRHYALGGDSADARGREGRGHSTGARRRRDLHPAQSSTRARHHR
jgi:primase-polymerase (primpol)-like protein